MGEHCEQCIHGMLGEIEYLKMQSQSINKRIKELEQPRIIADRVSVKPFLPPRFIECDCRNSVAFREYYDVEAWGHFLSLAKLLCRKNGVFRRKDGRWPYHMYEDERKRIKKISDMSPKDAEVAAEMLEELVSVYNRYMYRTHSVVQADFGDGDIIEVLVINPDDYVSKK